MLFATGTRANCMQKGVFFEFLSTRFVPRARHAPVVGRGTGPRRAHGSRVSSRPLRRRRRGAQEHFARGTRANEKQNGDFFEFWNFISCLERVLLSWQVAAFAQDERTGQVRATGHQDGGGVARKSILPEVHVRMKGRMVSFGGFEHSFLTSVALCTRRRS